MKLAIPYNDGKISEYFRKANHIKLYEIKDDKVVDTKLIDVKESSYISICKILHLENVELVLAQKIIEPANELLNILNVEVITGALGDADEAIDNFIKNQDALMEEYNESIEAEEFSCEDYCS